MTSKKCKTVPQKKNMVRKCIHDLYLKRLTHGHGPLSSVLTSRDADSELCMTMLLRLRVFGQTVRCVAGVLADVLESPAGPADPLESFISK